MPRLRLPWPLPALLGWGGAWALFIALRALGLRDDVALVLACLAGVAASAWGATWWRRLCIAAGFPLSLALSGLVALPGWAWLLPLALGLLVYPLNAWRDAPLFPTPLHALHRLPAHAPLREGAAVLDAGCGLGHGLRALRRAYPAARLHGVEWSWPLRLLCGLRCPWARVWRGNIWRLDWSPYALVYLFQRPESIARAALKAQAQMRPGAWLASLEFEAAEWQPAACVRAADGRPVWLYRMPMQSRDTPAADEAARPPDGGNARELFAGVACASGHPVLTRLRPEIITMRAGLQPGRRTPRGPVRPAAGTARHWCAPAA